MGSIIHVSGDYFAVAYNDNDYDGKVVTFTISSVGAIGAAETDTLEFDIAQGINGSIIHISGTMYAIVYTGDGNDGWVCTFNISTVGVIDNSVTATLEFDTAFAASPKIVKVSGDYYTISFKGTDNDGFIKTLPIYAAGTIGAVVSTLELDTADGQYPSMIKVGGTLFAVAYERDEGGGVLKGVLKSFTISSAGIISAVIGTLEFDTSRATYPNLLLIPASSGIVAVVYEGVDGDGFIKTAQITAGSVFPTDPLLRASGIRRTFWSGLGGQSVYQCELALGGMSTTYVSPIGSRDIPSAVTPTKLPSGAGYQEADYLAWLKQTDIRDILKLFGKFPSYADWVKWKQTPYFPKYF